MLDLFNIYRKCPIYGHLYIKKKDIQRKLIFFSIKKFIIMIRDNYYMYLVI